MPQTSNATANKFVRFLNNIVMYPDAHTLPTATVISWVENPVHGELLQEIMANVTNDNILTKDQVERFSELESQCKNKPFTKNDLDKLSKVIDDDKLEIAELKRKIKLAKQHKINLNMDIARFKEESSSLLNKTTELKLLKTKSKTALAESRENCKATCKIILQNFNLLIKSYGELCDLFKSEKNSVFLSKTDFNDILSAENEYNKKMANYSKQQFQDLSEAVDIDITNVSNHQIQCLADTTALDSENNEARSEINDDIERIVSSYPKLKLFCISSEAKAAAAKSTLSAAQAILDDLKNKKHVETEAELQQLNKECQNEIVFVKSQIDNLANNILPTLARENAPLQSTYILTGNYKQKLAWQKYYIEKQKFLISLLQQQRARLDLVWMLLEVEEIGHQKTSKHVDVFLNNLDVFTQESRAANELLKQIEMNVTPMGEKVAEVIKPNDSVAKSFFALLSAKPDQNEDTLKLFSELQTLNENLSKNLTTAKNRILFDNDQNEQNISELSKEVKTCTELLDLQMASGIPPRESLRLTDSKIELELDQLNSEYKTLVEEFKVELANKEKRKAQQNLI